MAIAVGFTQKNSFIPIPVRELTFLLALLFFQQIILTERQVSITMQTFQKKKLWAIGGFSA